MSTSFYSLQENEKLTKLMPQRLLNITKEDISKFFTDKTYGRVEKEMIRALFAFHYVNKNNLRRYLDERLSEFKWHSYDHVINRLWEDGVIERYQYGNINLYTLSKEGRNYILSQPKEIGRRNYVSPKEDICSILECASLAQWHISLMCGQDKITRTHFYENVQYGEYTLFAGSHEELWKNKFHYVIHSFCVPKNKENLEEFMLNLAAHHHALSGQKMKKGYIKDIRLYVLVAEDTEQIERMGRLLKSRTELKGAEYYFVLDAYTNETRGLDLLHLYQIGKEESSIKTLEFR